jgi:peroxiredoxin
MTIKVGDIITKEPLTVMDKEKGPIPISLFDFSKEKRIILVALPGAFTPTCHRNHLPGYVEDYESFKEKGIDEILCVSVNDIYVMEAWSENQSAKDKVLMFADGSAKFTKDIGMDVDLELFGMGTRSKRYSMFIENTVIKIINTEVNPGSAEISGSKKMLKDL